MTTHQEIIIKAEKRQVIGKKVKALRRQGILPGVIYGHKTEPIAIQMDAHSTGLIMAKLTGTSIVTLVCKMCINIGDQFARSVYYGRYKVIPIRTEIIRFCEHIGLDYMGAIIWQKTTTTNTTGGGAIMGSYPYPGNGILKSIMNSF